MSPDVIASRLLHRDAGMLVLDKPAGLPVHPDRKGGETVADWLEHLRFGLPRRPELAHRLDRETSGCLVLGRHPQALKRLGQLFASGQVEKTYWAVVEGVPDAPDGTLDLPLAPRSSDRWDWRVRVDPDGKPAVTRWRLLASRDGLAFLELSPLTGRTHQLRAHCAAAGWPIRGDRLYGTPAPGGLMLHARAVSVPLHPRKPPIRVEAPVPDAMAGVLEEIAEAHSGVRQTTQSLLPSGSRK